MVRKIGILLITYKYIQVNLHTETIKSLLDAEESLAAVNQEAETWYQQWEYLFRYSAIQLVEFYYNLCNIQTSLSYLSTKILAAANLALRPCPDYSTADEIDTWSPFQSLQ